MNAAREKHIRRVLLLELNNAFSNASLYCINDDDDQEFLQVLIDEVKVCVRGQLLPPSPPTNLDGMRWSNVNQM